MATHENYDSAISSLIVQVICCVWLPVLGRSSTWPIKKKKQGRGGVQAEAFFEPEFIEHKLCRAFKLHIC